MDRPIGTGGRITPPARAQDKAHGGQATCAKAVLAHGRRVRPVQTRRGPTLLMLLVVHDPRARLGRLRSYLPAQLGGQATQANPHLYPAPPALPYPPRAPVLHRPARRRNLRSGPCRPRTSPIRPQRQPRPLCLAPKTHLTPRPQRCSSPTRRPHHSPASHRAYALPVARSTPKRRSPDPPGPQQHHRSTSTPTGPRTPAKHPLGPDRPPTPPSAAHPASRSPNLPQDELAPHRHRREHPVEAKDRPRCEASGSPKQTADERSRASSSPPRGSLCARRRTPRLRPGRGRPCRRGSPPARCARRARGRRAALPHHAPRDDRPTAMAPAPGRPRRSAPRGGGGVASRPPRVPGGPHPRAQVVASVAEVRATSWRARCS
jgi:hypothetical protein